MILRQLNPKTLRYLSFIIVLTTALFWQSCKHDDAPIPCKGGFHYKLLDTAITNLFPYQGGEKLVYQRITPSDTDTFTFYVQPVHHSFDTAITDMSGWMKPETCDTVVTESLYAQGYDSRKNVWFNVRIISSNLKFWNGWEFLLPYNYLINGKAYDNYELVDTVSFMDVKLKNVMVHPGFVYEEGDTNYNYFHPKFGIMRACWPATGGTFEKINLIDYEK